MGVLKGEDNAMDLHKLQNNTKLHMLNFPYQRLEYIDELVQLMREGKMDPKNYYTHVLPAKDIEECVRLIQSKEALKVVLTFD